MKIGDYVRTKKRGFQYPQIARIKSMSITKDICYHNKYYIELDHNLIPDYEFHIYENDIDKSSPNIIDLIEVGDYVNGGKVYEKEKEYIVVNADFGKIFEFVNIYENNIKSIVTKEQFKSMEYKVGEDNE